MTHLSNGSQNYSVLADNSLPKNNPVTITEADVLITEALTLRPARPPDYATESQALRTLAQQLTDDPQSLLKTLVNMALKLCHADTVGVSLLETDPNGESMFRWVAIAGTLEFLEQGTTPSNFSPCGTTLFGNQPQLYAYPERYFKHLHHPQFSIVEGLVIPLSVKQRQLGTLWIVSHTEGRQFDAEDLRLMNSLAGFTTSALQSIGHLRQTAQLALQREQETQKALRDSQNHFEALVANVPGIVYRHSPTTDIPYRFTFINESCRELLELDPQTILQDGNSLVALIHPEDLPSFQTSIAHAVKNFLPWRWEGRIVTPSGQLKWIQGISRAVDTAEGDVWDGLLIEITEYKQAAAALSQSEEFNRQILESSDDCIKVLDLSGRILYMSPGGQALLKISDIKPFLNLGWSEFWQGADREGANNALALAKAGGIGTFQGYRPTETGEPKWWDSKISPIKGHDGQVERLLCISRDITERKQAQERLIASETRYRALTDLSPDAILVNLNGQFIYANSVAAQLLGATDTDQIIGRKPFDFIEPEYHELVRERIKRALQQQPLTPLVEQRWRRLDGLVVDVEVSAGTTTWQGQPAVQVILRDITARKRREANLTFLAEIGEDFSRLTTADEIMQVIGAKIGAYLKLTACHFVEVDESRGELTVNYGWGDANVPNLLRTYRTADYLSEEFGRANRAGETIVIRNTQIDPRTNAQAYAALKIQAFVTVPFHQNGEWKSFLSVIDSRSRNWRDYEIELIEEISNRIFPRLERARAESALRESEEKYRTLFNSIDEGYFLADVIFDKNDQPIDIFYVDANPSATRMMGEDFTGRRLSEIEPNYESYWYEIFGRVARTGKGERLEQYAEPDKKWYDFYVFKVGDEHSHRVAVVFNDITERQRREAERQQLLAQEQRARLEAEQANRIKDEFLAVLSHELRSPLNPILGWSSLLMTGKLSDVKVSQALSTIQRNAKLQSELIEDLLDVSRILSGKLSLNSSPVDLAATIRAAMETVQLAASAKSINMQAVLEPNIGFVLGDSTRLQQVIWNLLSNAVKFTPEGGQVKVQLSVVSQLKPEEAGEDKQEEISLQNPLAQITVSDTGQGIEPDFLPYVFDYFRQADAATTRKFGGLGLGLAIVRHLVELHGGTVGVESKGIGQGATFIVRLPLLITQAARNNSPSENKGSLDLSGIKILVVDDETDTRDFTAFLLEQSGAQVMAVSSAAEVLRVLNQSKFDVLLSDIGMPDVDGYMLIQQVRMLPEPGSKIPAIALTAYAGEMNQQQALLAGFQKHISKPIDPEVLVQAISSLVRD